MMRVEIFCLSLLFVCFSTHGMVKQNTPDERKFKVFSRRVGCVSVKSTETCPLSWKISSVLAATYSTTSTQRIPAILHMFTVDGASGECKENMKKTLCSQITPRCYEDGRLDYGDFNTTCHKIYELCPKVIVEVYKKLNFCGNLVTGEQQTSKCVAVSNPIKGVCPQPKYKMPSDILRAYEKVSKSLNQSFTLLEESKVFSRSCLSKMKELSCVPLYCSADEKYLLIEYNQEDCYSMIKTCFSKSSYPNVTMHRMSVKEICKVYPTPRSSANSSHYAAQFLFFVLSLFLKFFY